MHSTLVGMIFVCMNEALSLFFTDSCDSCASLGHVFQALTVTTVLMVWIHCTDGSEKAKCFSHTVNSVMQSIKQLL